MELRDLIDLDILLKEQTDKEARRLFGLEHKYGKQKQLKEWINKHRTNIGSQSQKALKRVSNIVYFISFILGFLTAATLLKFGFGESVNIMYILFFAAFLPLVLGIITIIYLFKPSNTELLPSAILQKIIYFFTKNELNINSEVLYYYNLKSAAFASFLFSLGLLLATFFIGVFKSLPFAWSTTLNLDAQSFYALIQVIGAPYDFLFKTPSFEAVELSRYVSGTKSLTNAKDLAVIYAQWWQFIIGAMLFYGVAFRAFVYILAKYRYKRVLNRAIFNLAGVNELLEDFNTPLIKTTQKSGSKGAISSNANIESIEQIDKLDALLGWAIDIEKLRLIKDTLAIDASYLESVGGLNDIAKDSKVINSLQGQKVAVFVNSYEVPTLDFLDFLQELASSAKVVYVIFSDAKDKDIAIWSNKIASLKRKNIYIKVYNDA